MKAHHGGSSKYYITYGANKVLIKKSTLSVHSNNACSAE